jgi:CSLREA domain-containing protein
MRTYLLRFIAITLCLALSSVANAATYTVNSTADPGDGTCDATCTLRDAIIASNAIPGQDTIDFGGIVLPTDTVPVTIMLFSRLPVISDSVIMEASIAETRALPGNPVKRPGIELNLAAAAPIIGNFAIPFFPNGLTLVGPEASGSVIRGFIINGINRAVPELCSIAFFNPDPSNPTVPAYEYCSQAISIFAATEVLIAGNYLNLDKDGEALAGNGVTGVGLTDASDCVIGGDTADDRNIMTAKDFEAGDDNGSYNMIQAWSLGWGAPAFGIPKKFNNNRIAGNYLGVTASGVALNPVARGIWLRNVYFEDAPFGPIGYGAQCDDQVLDPCVMQNNVIQGNTLSNRGGQSTFAFFGDQENTIFSDNTVFNTTDLQGTVEIFDDNTGLPVNMLVANNRFGIDTNGTPSSGPSRYGVIVGAGDRIRIENNIFTGALFDGPSIRDNTIFGSGRAVNVTLSRNSIFDNCISAEPLCQGVDLRGPSATPGPTPNDYLDPDIGANHLQNFPVLLEIEPVNGGGVVKLSAELNSSPDQVYLIEFFSNSTLNASGRAEGERFMGQKTVHTDEIGHVTFAFNYNEQSNGALAMVNGVTFITATATRKHCEPSEPTCLYGSTSEFSQACLWDTNEHSAINCEE